MIPQRDIDIIFCALCLWREARGELESVRIGAACVIRNRVRVSWIGDNNYQDVVTHPWQFSGLTAKGDPNLSKFPASNEGAWINCLTVADSIVRDQIADVTGGAVFYHDISIPGPPEAWGEVIQTAQLGRIKFYRPVDK